ncbi:MAG: protein kinase domain-containing protein [Burkholderiales bacterium]
MTTDLQQTLSSAPGVEVGQVIDGFKVEAHAHQGGMAHLWQVSKVDDPSAGPLIMKLPRVKGGDDPATVVGFEVEQMIMPTLSGPHVPRFIAKGDLSRRPYIVMECIQGPSLKPRFDAAPLAVQEVVEIGHKVATALHELHRQHVVHLDIKPSNILFRESGEAVLVDFGLSRHDQLPDLLEEEFELPMGTGPYMSPEQIQFIRNDPRSDLFALGVMLYALITGQRPFGAPNNVRGLRRRLYVDPVPPRKLNAQCPPWLQEIILRCLEVKPELRHQSAAQLAFDLLHPEQVPLTARAERMKASGFVHQFRRWFAAMGSEPDEAASATTQTQRCPIVLVALDIQGAEPNLLEAVRVMAHRILQTEAGARLACLTVMRTNRIGMDELVDAQGASKHMNVLVQLKHWARPMAQALNLKKENGRLTFHVLEAPDPAVAIIEYVKKNQVDHVVMGARDQGRLRRYLGSVSAQVAAESDCTVTVVRSPSTDSGA